MNFKKHESGRSMVEMLGVLAIIGVLSVGGIAGYSLSMRRHRANQVVDYISKKAVSEYSKCQKIALDEGIDVEDCDAGISFCEDTDVGPLPAGVSCFWVSDWDNERSSQNDNDSEGLDMFTVFTDQKLCQAVAATVGGTCRTSSPSWHSITIPFNMN